MGPIVAAKGCSPPQELERAGRRAAIFLVSLINDDVCGQEKHDLARITLRHGMRYGTACVNSRVLTHVVLEK